MDSADVCCNVFKQKSRSTEVEGLLGQVQAPAREPAVATPAIDVILPLLRGLDRSLRGV